MPSLYAQIHTPMTPTTTMSMTYICYIQCLPIHSQEQAHTDTHYGVECERRDKLGTYACRTIHGFDMSDTGEHYIRIINRKMANIAVGGL